jgi:hypothetical protein
MAYWWLNIIIAITVGGISGLLLSNWLKSKRLIFSLVTLIATLLAFIAAFYFITPYYKISSFAKLLKNQPVFAGINKQDPNVFNAFLVAARPLILKQRTPGQLVITAEQLEQRVFNKMVSKAPDSAIMPYVKATIALYSKLLMLDPKLVLIYEFPQYFKHINPYTIDTVTFQQEFNQLNSAKAAIIMATIKNPQTKPQHYEVKYLIKYVTSRLATKYGKHNVQLAFTDPANAKLDPTVGAQIIIGYYQEIAKLNAVDTGKIIRFTK